MFNYSIEYFSALALKEFYLRTGEYNIAAQKIYLGTGFSHIPEGDRITTNGVNELIMKYDIIGIAKETSI